jgi:restriction system protein
VQKELASSFFKVRLWSQAEIMEELFSVYESIDPDIKAELPLIKIWTLALEEAE